MPSALLLKDFRGLVTATGALARPQAAASVLDNFVVDGPGVLRKRPGAQPSFPGVDVLSSAATRIFMLAKRQAVISPVASVVVDGTLSALGLTGTAEVYFGNIGTGIAALTRIGSRDLQPHPQTRGTWKTQRARSLEFIEDGNSLYSAGWAGGPRRVEWSGSEVRYAGMPRGMAPDTYNMTGAAGGTYDVLTGAPGTLLPVNWARAYRVTWHRRAGTNAPTIGGAPTGRLVVRNINGTSGWVAATTKDVALRVRLPKEHGTEDEYSGGSAGTAITTDYFVRVWATRSWNTTTDTGDDECYLQTEQFVTAGDIAAGYLTITDNTPDSFLLGSTKLHTNTVDFPEAGPAQGQVFADESPPICLHLAQWRDVTWYANGQVRPQALLKQLALPADGATYADGVVTITAKNAPAAATHFQIVNALGSVALNIEATSRNFCEVYNRQANAAGRAYYISLGNQMPGLILVEMRQVRTSSTGGALAFTFTLTNTNAIQSQVAGLFTIPNSLWFSKPVRPDAVPPVQLLYVGSRQNEILALKALRDRLLVFTTEGVYQVTGTSAFDFSVSVFDATKHLAASGTVETLGDTVFAWCLEGICEFTSAGSTVISLPIGPTVMDVLRVIRQTFTPLAAADSRSEWLLLDWHAFAVVDERANRVRFFYPNDLTTASTSDYTPQAAGCSYALVWDANSRLWSSESYSGENGANDLRFSDAAWDRTSGSPFLVSKYGTGLWKQAQDFAATDYRDIGVAAAAVDIASQFQPVVQLPDSLSVLEWREWAVLFEDSELAWRPRPTAFSLLFEDARRPTPSESPSSLALSPTISEGRVRGDVPQAFRRANRQKVTLLHTAREFCGVYGLALETVDATRQGVKT